MQKFEYTPEIREKMRQAKLKNPTKYWKGKKFSVEYKKKLSEAHKEQKCWYGGKSGESHPAWKGGKPKCLICNKPLTSYKGKGCKSHNPSCWRGGITPLRNQIRSCFRYRQWISDIFTRDDYICRLCGVRGGALVADHYPDSFLIIFNRNNIKSLEDALNYEELWNINNGRTLCKSCHLKTENYGKRK